MFEEYLKELEDELIKLGVKTPASIVEEYRQKFLNLREKGQSDFEILVLLGDAPDVARSVVKGRKESAEETLEHNFMLLQQNNRRELKENGLPPDDAQEIQAETPKEPKKKTQSKKTVAAKSVSAQSKKPATKEKSTTLKANQTLLKSENEAITLQTPQESAPVSSNEQNAKEPLVAQQPIEQNQVSDRLAEESIDVPKKQEKFSPLADGLYTVLSAVAILFANVLIVAVALLSLCAGLYFTVQSFLIFEETAFKVMGFFSSLIGVGLGIGMGFAAYKMIRYTVKAMGEYAKKLKNLKKENR